MKTEQTPTEVGGSRAALSVSEFCRAYSISRALFYVLLRKGQGPQVMRVGSRVLVSVDAARNWQRQCEGA